ncbi:hypothetical protein RRF57_012015 [Xylaria bambusicola]|uniref:Uncharacterized protein n=1 Tax=Xylaria bambusicola TaxID=326684 RepID=A0AAN7UYY9_9PEZI
MDDLQERMSLGINLLPATEEDARRAALVDFGVGASSEQDETLDGEMNNNRARIHDAALTKPLFASHSAPRGTQHGESQKTTDSGSRSEEQRGKKRLKSEIKAASTRDSLVSSLTRNTRASQDPFILPFIPGPRGAEASTTKSTTTTSRIQGIKRKRPANHPQQSNSHQSPPSSMQTPPKQIREEEGKPEQEADERQQVENRTTDNKTNHRPSGSGSGLLSSSSILEPSKAMATSTSTLVEYDSD